MSSKVASRADLWYNEASNIVALVGATNTALALIRLVRRHIMDSVSPHANNGNPFAHIPATSGIYKITCTANKRVYVGSAINLRKRLYEHFRTLRNNTHINIHLQRAWNKYGEEFFVGEVVELVLPISLTAREQYWFHQLKPFGKKGFNIAPEAGSNLGVKMSPEVVERNRQVRLGKPVSPEHAAKNRVAALGVKRTPEQIEHLRQIHLGRKHSPEQIEKQRQSHIGQIGRKKSPEEIEKIRQAQLRRKQSPEYQASIEKMLQTRARKKQEKSHGNE